MTFEVWFQIGSSATSVVIDSDGFDTDEQYVYFRTGKTAAEQKNVAIFEKQKFIYAKQK